MTSRALIVGCGDLGSALAAHLCQEGWHVTGLSRTLKSLSQPHFTSMVGDVTQAETLTSIKDLQPEIIVYCVAASAQTDAAYQLAYVEGLKNVLATQANNAQLRAVFFVSSTRVYGQAAEHDLDENTLPQPADFGGKRLLEAEQLLNNFSAPSSACQKIVLRLSGIYGPGRTRMLTLAKNPSAWPAQNSWSNRIHRDDAAAFMAYLVRKIMSGQTVLPCLIVTDSQPSPQWEVLAWLAAQMRIAHTQTNVPAVNGGKKLSNHAMLATGFQLQYPHYQAGYAALLNHPI